LSWGSNGGQRLAPIDQDGSQKYDTGQGQTKVI
jgi:hypothetical protein